MAEFARAVDNALVGDILIQQRLIAQVQLVLLNILKSIEQKQHHAQHVHKDFGQVEQHQSQRRIGSDLGIQKHIHALTIDDQNRKQQHQNQAEAHEIHPAALPLVFALQRLFEALHHERRNEHRNGGRQEQCRYGSGIQHVQIPAHKLQDDLRVRGKRRI